MATTTKPARTAPMSKSAFLKATSKALQVNIGNIPQLAESREFSTGKVGYYCGGKLTLEVDGKPVTFQMGLNLTAIHSEEWPA